MASFFEKCRKAGLHYFRCGLEEPTAENPAHSTEYRLKASLLVWAEEGFPTFTMSLKQAGVFSATNCSDVLVDEIQLPFPVYGVLLDSPLHSGFEPFFLVSNQQQTKIRWIKLMFPEESWPWRIGDESDIEQQAVFCCGSDGIIYGRFAPSLSDLGRPPENSKTDVEYFGGVEANGPGLRWMTVCSRMAIGMILSLDHSGTCAASLETRHHNADLKRNLASYPEFRFTSPIVLDIWREVREWVASGGGPLSVKTLVCGHWKLQVCGPGRTGRKRIHVMPYWRGPDDAPVALRSPHIKE